MDKNNIPSPQKISFDEEKKVVDKPKENINLKSALADDSIDVKIKSPKLAVDKKSPTTNKIITDKNIYEANLKPTNLYKEEPSKIENNIENESETVPHKQNDRNEHSSLKLFFKIIATIIIFLIFTYIFTNFDALITQATFERKDNDISEYVGKFEIKNIKFAIAEIDDLVFLPVIMGFPKPEIVEFPPKEEEKKEEEPAPVEEPVREVARASSSQNISTQVANTLNNQLIIPSLGIKVPVVWGSPVDENTMLANLQHGVVNYAGTAKPGEGLENNTGNVFISGHSSYYSWDPGRYNSIFATLPNIGIGDQIAIGYYDKVYVYEVYDRVEVSPGDVDVVRQNTDNHIVSLMTCVPIGTNERRFIARAKFIGYAE